MQQPPVPEARDLLPPLLACLPTTFASPHPPPALLPLLAPILRQRLTYLGTSTSRDGWVRLLCWNSEQATKLPGIVEQLDLEPHPVSGEVEIDDVETVRYCRVDDETLRARLEVEQFSLLPVYVWCENDEHGQTGPGWKLAELRALEDLEDGKTWFDTALEANRAFASQSRKASRSGPSTIAQSNEVEQDEDDYWAAYDRTPGRTPSLQQTPAPRDARPPLPNVESDYYARYEAEVQPALDSHDPDEEHEEIGQTTLLGTQQRERIPTAPPTDDDRPAWEKALYPHAPTARAPHDSAIATSLSQSIHSELNMPRPISPASSMRSIEKLEEQAAAMSDDSTNSRAEMGVRQHISTDIKSLFRLAKSTGMNRKEFERVVKRELEVLTLLDDE